MTWNVDDAVANLQTKAHANSQGRCARYIREAVAAGGIALQRTTHAKDYGNSLIAAGFVAFNTAPEDGYRKGDIVVVEGFSEHPSGHMQMYDGSIWISDFKQVNGFWPGPNYRKRVPAFKVYRHP